MYVQISWLTQKDCDTYVISPTHDLIVIKVDGGPEAIAPQTGTGGRFYQARARLSTVHVTRRHDNEDATEVGTKIAEGTASPTFLSG